LIVVGLLAAGGLFFLGLLKFNPKALEFQPETAADLTPTRNSPAMNAEAAASTITSDGFRH
jgi:hypothetical protein